PRPDGDVESSKCAVTDDQALVAEEGSDLVERPLLRMRRRWRALVKEHPQLRPLLVRDAEVGSLWSGDNRQPLENRVVKELRSEKRPVEFRRQHPRDHQVRLTLGIRIIFVHGKLIEIPAYLSYGVETGLRAR